MIIAKIVVIIVDNPFIWTDCVRASWEKIRLNDILCIDMWRGEDNHSTGDITIMKVTLIIMVKVLEGTK